MPIWRTPTASLAAPPPSWAALVSFEGNTVAHLAAATDTRITAVPIQFSMAPLATFIFPMEVPTWIPCIPIIPLVIHAPGTCQVCDMYMAHLPQVAGVDNVFKATVQGANTHLRLTITQQLVVEGWSQGGENLAQRLHD